MSVAFRRLVAVGVLVTGVALDARQRPIAGVSTTSSVSDARLRLAVDRMMYDRWYPPASIPPPPAHPDDQGMLTAALVGRDVGLRHLAIRLLGRFEQASDAATLEQFMQDPSPVIRRDAVLSLGQALSRSTGRDTDAAEGFLETRLQVEQALPPQPNGKPTPSIVAPVIIQTISVMHYEPATLARAQRFLVSHGTVEAVATVIIQNPAGPITEDARQLLLRYAKPVPPDAPNLKAMEALIAAGAGTSDIAIYATRYHCIANPSPDCGGDVRVLGVRMMDPRDPGVLPVLEEALRDSSLRVQAEAFRRLPATNLKKVSCESLLAALTRADALDDQKVSSTLRVLDMVTPKCQEADDITAQLKAFASLLGDALNNGHWHVPARALTKLAVFAPDAARTLVHEVAAGHDVWHVRAAAVAAADAIGDVEPLVLLADDAEPNVRSLAIPALAKRRHPSATTAALKALEQSDDHQLVVVAAAALRGLRADERTVASEALMKALDRLTRQGKDTSRGPRLEILERLKELAPPDATGRSLLGPSRLQLEEYLKDVDPIVASAAADVIGQIVGVRPQPKPTYRPPEQPTEADLAEVKFLMPGFAGLVAGGVPRPMPMAHATLQLTTGDTLYLGFAVDDAPVAVARFLKLARAHYFDGQIVYRLIPDGWISAGSPGANDYSGDARFWRDEISTDAHAAGSVGLLTHGRDTGDGRFFIALDVLPAFEDTVFANVVTGDVGKLLEGSKIVSIKVAPQMQRR